jgi:hypothetical protein
MRNVMILGGAIGALMFASFGGVALAANTNPSLALSTRLGERSCASFVHLSKSHQESLVRRMIGAAPATSISASKSAASGGDSAGQTSSGQTPAAGRLAPSDIVAACQAATGATTIRDAYAKFSTGAGIGTNH